MLPARSRLVIDKREHSLRFSLAVFYRHENSLSESSSSMVRYGPPNAVEITWAIFFSSSCWFDAVKVTFIRARRTSPGSSCEISFGNFLWAIAGDSAFAPTVRIIRQARMVFIWVVDVRAKAPASNGELDLARLIVVGIRGSVRVSFKKSAEQRGGWRRGGDLHQPSDMIGNFPLIRLRSWFWGGFCAARYARGRGAP
jgi:hypothetical protein